MKTVRRGMLLLVVMLLVVPLQLYSSGADEPQTAEGDEPVTITMWDFPLTGDDQQLFEPLKASFAQKFPNIEVSIQIVPWSGRYEKMLSAIAGGNPPETVYLNAFQIPLLASTGNLLNLSERLPESDLQPFSQATRIGVSYQNTVYSLPILRGVIVYLYNTDLFRERGLDPDNPPLTWAELESALKVLTKGDGTQWGARFDLNRASPITSIMPFVWQGGAQAINESGDVVLNSPDAVRALSFITGLYEKGYIARANIQGGGLKFSTGKIGIEFGAEPSYVNRTVQENPDLNFRVGPVPQDKRRVSYNAAGSYAVFSKSANPAAGLEWAKHLTSREGALHIDGTIGVFSARDDLDSSEYLTDPNMIFMATQLKYSTEYGLRMGVHYSEILGVLDSEFKSIVLGVKTPEQGIADATQQVERIVK